MDGSDVFCGFIPPYVLEALASNAVDNYSQVAASESLAATQSLLDNHQDFPSAHSENQVSQSLQSSGFIPAYILQSVAHSEQVDPQARGDAQATLATDTERVQLTLKRKIYDCEHKDILPGKLVRSEGQVRIADRNINNCYDGFGITANFYKEVFGRNSLDDNGLELIGSCHYQPHGTTGGYDNAYWDGANKQMVFGDGDGIVFDYLTDSLDVIAHELSHGFVQFTSPLKYQAQSGALNESVADVFACMVEQWHTNHTVDQADWLVGQTIFPVAFKGSCLRTLKKHKAYENDPIMNTDPQPKHMRDYNTRPEDNQGVHINSGIPNHAFYLAAMSLGGYSWEGAGRVWYETMMSKKIPFECDFETFAKVTIEVAKEIFPKEKGRQKAVENAWIQVGVIKG